MRLSIDHRTVYRFSEPQSRLVQMLRMTPEASHDQTVARWRIDVDCDATMRRGRDGFGNAVTMLYCEGPIADIEIAVRGEVLTSHSDGVVRGVAEVLPPAVFLRATEATPRDPAIAAFAVEASAGATGPIGMLHRLNRAFNGRFGLDRVRPEPGLSAADAFLKPTATSRDLAQMFVVASRSLGIPARYVSGYIHPDPAFPTGTTVTGESHAWVEWFCGSWRGFDPTNDLEIGERHVLVGRGRDYSDVAPLRGIYAGPFGSRLFVEVEITREA